MISIRYGILLWRELPERAGDGHETRRAGNFLPTVSLDDAVFDA